MDSNDKGFCVFVVDDDPVIQTLFQSILAKDFAVEIFSSSEDCLQRLEEASPDLFLLDVGLPGIDGYALCRLIRDNPATHDVPVTFISGHDSEEDRLIGYDAGGDDFVVKPFNTDELLQKVRIAQRLRNDKLTLRQQISESEMLTSLVLSNMDEYAVIVQFIRKLTECIRGEDVAEAALGCLRGLQLAGVVQVRFNDRKFTMSPEGRDRPLEVSVMENVRHMERIFEFKMRAVFNFHHISMMVNNMPVHDPELCGRIRDHLAIAAEVADSRLDSIQTSDANSRKQEGIYEVLEHIREIIEALGSNQQKARLEGTSIIFRVQEEFARAFVSLGLTEGQEETIDQIVRRNMEDLVKLYDRTDNTQSMLAELGQTLEKFST